MSPIQKIASLDELALFLDIDRRFLDALIVSANPSDNYSFFRIAKKSGGTRLITAPKPALALVQTKLKTELDKLYEPRAQAHGFIKDRSVLTNASFHVGKRWVINVDLQDFFPSISTPRVAGLLKNKPYSLNPDISMAVARITTCNGSLPMGSPASPVISNMICRRLDSRLTKLATLHNAWYSRYADDITLSMNAHSIPHAFAVWDQASSGTPTDLGNKWGVGPTLANVIRRNGFQINPAKVRIQHRSTRQMVTGLVVNEFANVPRTYIRELRAVLHSWESLGYEAAQAKLCEKKGWEEENSPNNLLASYVAGKLSYLSMVRQESLAVQKLNLRYETLRALATKG